MCEIEIGPLLSYRLHLERRITRGIDAIDILALQRIGSLDETSITLGAITHPFKRKFRSCLTNDAPRVVLFKPATRLVSFENSAMIESAATMRASLRGSLAFLLTHMYMVTSTHQKLFAAAAASQRVPSVRQAIVGRLALQRGEKCPALEARDRRLWMLQEYVARQGSLGGKAFPAVPAIEGLVVVLLAVREEDLGRRELFAAKAAMKTMQ